MNGWTGIVLRVNLSTNEVRKEPLDPVIAHDFIGGRGVGTKYLYDEINPKVDALGPDNKLILATGPLTATLAVCSGRYMAITKSPLTGAIACSNSGGFFPHEMKFAGYDMIIIEGKSPKPVYIWIENDQVEIRPARHIWGERTQALEEKILSETDSEAKVLSIGPAGEKLSRVACIMNDTHRAAGRSGVGAVMGSKHLKAIAIRGTKSVTVAEPKEFRNAVLRAMKKIKESPGTGEGMPTYGTAGIVNIINENGLFPTRNFQEGVFDGASKISGEAIHDNILITNKACSGCMIACGRVSRSQNPKYEGFGEGPEYETVWSFGADCGIDNLDAIFKANLICNELGMDTIAAGATIGCAMEMAEKGIIPEKDIGMPLKFGDTDAMIALVEMMGLRKGFGDKLSDGAYRLAELYGHPEFFMGVKKQDFAAYDPRGAWGMGVQYATSNRGACHVRGFTVNAEILGSPEKMDPFTTVGKAKYDIECQDTVSVVDAVGICLFVTFGFGLEEIREMLNSATGIKYTPESLIKVGERIWNIEKLFNLKAGLTRADDTLPKRILKEGLPGGPAKGKIVDLEPMLAEYYKLRGWDEQGVPMKKKLKELGLV